MSENVRVTLCMITKNEATNIAGCINSVRHLIDEIIVVDTGSQDATVEQATMAGATVFTFDWQHNFAEARNYGLDQATGDWILVLDADEVLADVDAGKFSKLLTTDGIEGYYVSIESYIGSGQDMIFDQVVRLFRNRPQYRFSGAIHEQVAGCIMAQNQGTGLALADLRIIHQGYLNVNIQAKNKHCRNMEVINQALENSPAHPFLLYSLGIEYMQQGDVASGNEQLSKALQYMTGKEEYFHKVVLALAAGLLQTGDVSRAKELINNMAAIVRENYELLLLKGIIALHDADYEAAVRLLQQSAAGIDDKSMASAIHSQCGDLYNTLSYYDQAEKEYFTALKIVPQQLYPLLQIIGIKQKGKSQLSWQQIGKFASPEINNKLQLILIKQGEVPLAMVAALLNMLNCNPGNPALMAACDNYLFVETHYQPADDLSRIVKDYLRLSAEMIRLYADKGINRSLLPVVCIDDIVCSCLDAIIKTLCPTWFPCIGSNNLLSIKK